MVKYDGNFYENSVFPFIIQPQSAYAQLQIQFDTT